MQDRLAELRQTLVTASRQVTQAGDDPASALGSLILALEQVAAALEELDARLPGEAVVGADADTRPVGVHDPEELEGAPEATAAALAAAQPVDALAEPSGEVPAPSEPGGGAPLGA